MIKQALVAPGTRGTKKRVLWGTGTATKVVWLEVQQRVQDSLGVGRGVSIPLLLYQLVRVYNSPQGSSQEVQSKSDTKRPNHFFHLFSLFFKGLGLYKMNTCMHQ